MIKKVLIFIGLSFVSLSMFAPPYKVDQSPEEEAAEVLLSLSASGNDASSVIKNAGKKMSMKRGKPTPYSLLTNFVVQKGPTLKPLSKFQQKEFLKDIKQCEILPEKLRDKEKPKQCLSGDGAIWDNREAAHNYLAKKEGYVFCYEGKTFSDYISLLNHVNGKRPSKRITKRGQCFLDNILKGVREKDGEECTEERKALLRKIFENKHNSYFFPCEKEKRKCIICYKEIFVNRRMAWHVASQHHNFFWKDSKTGKLTKTIRFLSKKS